MADEETSSLRKTGFFRILGVVLLALVVAGGIWFFRRTKGTTSKSNANAQNESVVLPQPVDARQGGSTPEDADKDGLTNEEEANLGTNPTVTDSDQDGISDYDEARVYRIDPLKVDTDGDGFPDGDEVKRGFNPNGEGKLFDTKPPMMANTNT